MIDKTPNTRSAYPLRVVTAAALFDGHDATINIFRRLLVAAGMEVIHLGHNRSVAEIAAAAVQEDAQAVAVSSYQGGHMEFYRFLVDQLRSLKAHQIQVFGGGGGVILADEIAALKAYGMADIYTPEDGARLGLDGIVQEMLHIIHRPGGPGHTVGTRQAIDPADLTVRQHLPLARMISMIERNQEPWASAASDLRSGLLARIGNRRVPVIGITGSGGAGKSSLADELIQRLLHDKAQLQVAVISIDPSRRKTGGALLGDRIRMNTLVNEGVFMRSMATRQAPGEIPNTLADITLAVKAAGFDLILVETAGIGQGDSRIVDLADLSIFVMTPEYGAATQLEKIDMLDFADMVAVNKFDKLGGEDAVRGVDTEIRQRRTMDQSGTQKSARGLTPVIGTIAAKFNDGGVTDLYRALLAGLKDKIGVDFGQQTNPPEDQVADTPIVEFPQHRSQYLSEIAEVVRHYHLHTNTQAQALRRAWHLEQTEAIITHEDQQDSRQQLKKEITRARAKVEAETDQLLDQWHRIRQTYDGDELAYRVRETTVRSPLFFQSLAGQNIPKIALPRIEDPGALYHWLRCEHLPGYFPFTAGVFPLKRQNEDPTRMFAGEGDPHRTNRRFKMLSADSSTKRISTAFDSVALYGFDPDRRPDIYGKIGNAGVSIATLDDVKTLYSGFDLCDPATSVSMTINGPAPIILAMFFNAAIDQQAEKFELDKGRPPDPREYAAIKAQVLTTVRGTVQADILKEDQGQNTCIFAIDFALKMMGDIQQYFVTHHVRNFYSVSISGYHIAEAGANPITQLAFTLANGFTYLEYYLARGMDVDDITPNFSFFFSNGMDPEYTVIGRVARRIWAIALRDRYGASERAQMLKYHIQTSGRSLHVQDIHFNDIRTTLQGLCAIYDNCQSLHTNAYDEAVTTPTEASVRRALAIQMIINQEWGPAKNENPLQGSFIIDELTDLVETAVLAEFDRITRRGGVLGAMESGYQRSKIQEESLRYESLKHSGELPIIGVNTFRDPAGGRSRSQANAPLALARSTEAERESQIERLSRFQRQHADHAPRALHQLQKVVLTNGNTFEALMAAVRHCSLGQITQTLFSVGGQYRRNL